MSNVNNWLTEHGDYLYRFALARLRDPHQAEDAVQETLLAAMQSQVSGNAAEAGAYAGKSTPRTWLTGILKHKIIDLMRRNSREQPTENLGEGLSSDFSQEGNEDGGMDDFFDATGHWSEPPESWDLPDGALQQKQFLAVLQGCLDRLPVKLAQLFMLREVHEDDNEEICKELDISPTNAWVMLYRARMGLRKCVELNW